MIWFKYIWIAIAGVFYLAGWRYVIKDIIETKEIFGKAFYHHFKPFVYCWISSHISIICIISLCIYIFGRS